MTYSSYALTSLPWLVLHLGLKIVLRRVYRAGSYSSVEEDSFSEVDGLSDGSIVYWL